MLSLKTVAKHTQTYVKGLGTKVIGNLLPHECKLKPRSFPTGLILLPLSAKCHHILESVQTQLARRAPDPRSLAVWLGTI